MNSPTNQPLRKTASRYGGRLLIVDDNQLNRSRLAQRLKDNGYEVETIDDGFKSLELVRNEKFDLILLDTMMPGMPGEEVLRELKDDPATRDIPVIMISGLDEAESVATCIELGAADILSSPFDPVLLRARIDACLENRRLREQEAKHLLQLQAEMEHTDRLVNVVIPIGLALMREPDYDKLLEKILIEAKSICRADAGTLYLRFADKFLNFALVRNDSLKINLGGSTGNPIKFPPLNLFDPETGKPNHQQVACHVALTGKSVNIADAYNVDGFDFRGTREFDQRTGYRSQSFLTAPLLNEQNEVIGVLQLINAQDPEGKIIPFDPILQQSVESLSLLAAAAVENYQKLQSIPAT